MIDTFRAWFSIRVRGPRKPGGGIAREIGRCSPVHCIGYSYTSRSGRPITTSLMFGLSEFFFPRNYSPVRRRSLPHERDACTRRNRVFAKTTRSLPGEKSRPDAAKNRSKRPVCLPLRADPSPPTGPLRHDPLWHAFLTDNRVRPADRPTPDGKFIVSGQNRSRRADRYSATAKDRVSAAHTF